MNYIRYISYTSYHQTSIRGSGCDIPNIKFIIYLFFEKHACSNMHRILSLELHLALWPYRVGNGGSNNLKLLLRVMFQSIYLNYY